MNKVLAVKKSKNRLQEVVLHSTGAVYVRDCKYGYSLSGEYALIGYSTTIMQAKDPIAAGYAYIGLKKRQRKRQNDDYSQRG